MKSLQTVQKTFRVFQIITLIAFILSVVGAATSAVALLCVISWHSGGQVFGIFGEQIQLFVSDGEWSQAAATLITDMVILTTEAVLLSFACSYFKDEQIDGTPFTESGADRLRKLGIRFIYMPIAAIIVASVILVCMGVESGDDFSNLPSVIVGVILILASFIFRYGADLESGRNDIEVPLLESAEQQAG